MDKEHQVLLKILSVILIEIRAATDIRMANSLADVFHRLPTQIANGIDLDEIHASLKETAMRCGQSKYLDALLKHYST